MTVTLVTATPEDLDRIMAIETASFGDTAWTASMMRQELASEWNYYVLAIESTDGAASAVPNESSEMPTTAAALDDSESLLGYAGLRAVEKDGDVQTIAVAEHARGRGLGRRLLRNLLEEAARRRVRSVFLDVRADNPSARALYESEGFIEIGVRPNYYASVGVDAIVMKKVFS
ncbi:ribosomal protein S18-alanine N-acetyltransferase [Humidisolicoccus flavus]|uniref:ribosomal protein S18-alanine N-acetyltransferase n=1 Tax=Humidisolicoccus flavus TaxID=3111414 RepID=UPI00324BD24D